MNIADILTIIGPTAAVSALLTYLIARRKETRADIDQIVFLLKEDNERLRMNEAQMSKQIEVHRQTLIGFERRLMNLQNKLILLESAHNDSPLPMWLKDTDGRMLALNKSYEQVFLKPLNLTSESYINKYDRDIWPEEIAVQFEKHDKTAMNLGVIDTNEVVPDGEGNLVSYRIIKHARFVGTVLIGVAGVAVPEQTIVSKN